MRISLNRGRFPEFDRLPGSRQRGPAFWAERELEDCLVRDPLKRQCIRPGSRSANHILHPNGYSGYFSFDGTNSLDYDAGIDLT